MYTAGKSTKPFQTTHFVDRRDMSSPPADFMAADEPVAVLIHIPLDHVLKENTCVHRVYTVCVCVCMYEREREGERKRAK